MEGDMEMAVQQLRKRWELASVFNFLQVFESVVSESKMLISGEEIETGLITPNTILAHLHITLLKGIPPVSKVLNNPDGWIIELRKRLVAWWPWVAEGDNPLKVAKGEEIDRYKELDPTTRLLVLKALCEIRALQDDIVSYVNGEIKKDGGQVSKFRKDMIGGDERIAYWLDANSFIGHRLYKEVRKLESNPKSKENKGLPSITSEWETLATNFEEFCKVVDEFSSSKSKVEVDIGKTIETDVIPILDNIQKKKEKALKQKQKQEMLLNGFCNSGIARSTRNRMAVSYTFDAYDKAIDEAIQVTKKRKTTKELAEENKQGDNGKTNKIGSNRLLASKNDVGKSSADKDETSETNSERDSDDSYAEIENVSKEDDAYNEDDNNSSGSEDTENEIGNQKQATKVQKQIHRHFGSRWSSRLAGTADLPPPEDKDMVAKNRSRQRPTRNTALDSIVILDSEDEQSSDEVSSQNSGSENSQ